MPDLSKTFGTSGPLALTTTKEAGGLSGESGWKLSKNRK